MSAPPDPESPRPVETRPQAPHLSLPAQQAFAARQASVAEESSCCAISLQAFAFMPYKLQGRMWADPVHNKTVYEPMMAAAEAWVHRRKCTHPDLHFFVQRMQPLPMLHW